MLEEDDFLLLHREPTQLHDLRVIISDLFGRRCGYLKHEHEHLIAPDLDMNIVWRAQVINTMCYKCGTTPIFLWIPEYAE